MNVVAYSTLACPDWTVEEAAEAVSRYGYAAIEWRIADGAVIDAALPVAVRQRLITATQTHHLHVITLDTSCRLVHVDEQQRLATLAEAIAMLHLAHDLGAPAIRVFGGDPPAGVTAAEAVATAADMLREIAALAAPLGLWVLLETHDRLWSLSKNARLLLDTAAAPNCGIIWDSFHTFRVGETPEQSLQMLKPYVASVHMKDGRQTEQGWQLCLPGDGELPLHHIIAILRAEHYEGPLCFEWEKQWHPELAAPEIALPLGYQVISNLLL